MSAMLVAPVLTPDVEAGDGLFRDEPDSGKALDFSTRTLENAVGLIRARDRAALDAIPASTDRPAETPPHDTSLLRAAHSEVTAEAGAGPEHQPPIPESPGAALLQEFDALYYKYRRRVYRQCFRMLGNAEDAEDLTQEVFLQLYRKAHTFRGDASFSTWLHRLTVNCVLMRVRRHRRWRDSVTSMDVAPGVNQEVSDILTKVSALPAPTSSTLDRIGLDMAIAQLSSGYKEIFLLHDLEGYRHDEIARFLAISEGTSKSQLHKARLRLRELMTSTGRAAGRHRPSPKGRSARKKPCRAPREAECVPV